MCSVHTEIQGRKKEKKKKIYIYIMNSFENKSRVTSLMMQWSETAFNLNKVWKLNHIYICICVYILYIYIINLIMAAHNFNISPNSYATKACTSMWNWNARQTYFIWVLYCMIWNRTGVLFTCKFLQVPEGFDAVWEDKGERTRVSLNSKGNTYVSPINRVNFKVRFFLKCKLKQVLLDKQMWDILWKFQIWHAEIYYYSLC